MGLGAVFLAGALSCLAAAPIALGLDRARRELIHKPPR
jgi:hypothetical protein